MGNLPEQLRQEANELKDCFTRFSFQAIAFTAVVFGLLARSPSGGIFSTLACIVLVTMLLAVARIGCYKYAGANSNYGYQLHLERVKNLTKTEAGWKHEMTAIGWEEAMRAWRVVQPTVFRYLYFSHALLPNYLRPKHRKSLPTTRWFEPATLVKTGSSQATYHSGRYLRLTLSMLYVLAGFATVPVFQWAWRLQAKGAWHWRVAAALGLGLVLLILYRVWLDLAIVSVLERGLLSIPSCAVLWQAVVVAHYRAIRATAEGSGVGFENYTRNLALQAEDLTKSLFRIDSWIGYGTQA